MKLLILAPSPIGIVSGVVAGFFALLVVGAMILYSLISNYKMKERARKIDPTVSTMAEADYVLKKDIAKSVSQHAVNQANNNNEETIFCKHCGAKIDADSKFCKSCGKEQ